MAGQTDAALAALQQILQQSGVIPPATKRVAAAEPNAKLYGIFNSAEPARLAKQDDAIRGPWSDIASRHAAERERQDYAKALQDAQLGAENIARIEARGKSGTALTGQLDAMGKYGIFGGVTIDESGVPVIDPVLGATSNATALNERNAGVFKDTAAGVKDLYGAGIKTDPSVVAGRTRHSADPDGTNEVFGVDGQPTGTPKYGVFNKQGASVEDQSREEHFVRQDANDAVSAQASMVNANRPRGSDQPMITIAPGVPGQPQQVTIRGRPDAVAPYMNGDQRDTQRGGLSARMDAAIKAGSSVQQVGDKVKITGRSGAVKYFDANNNEVAP